jgi:hypothetical protein
MERADVTSDIVMLHSLAGGSGAQINRFSLSSSLITLGRRNAYVTALAAV